MAILNYTTSIDANKTIAEVQQLLVKRGCKKIIADYDDKMQPVNLSFIIIWKDVPTVFVLSCNYEGVLRCMQKEGVRTGLLTKEHALKVGWRIIKTWLLGQLALVDAELSSMPEVFLSKAVTKNGSTLFTFIESDRALLLTN